MGKSVTDEAALRGALRRYQVAAIVTGVFLVLVFVGVFLKYVVQPDNEPLLEFFRAVQMIHGIIYIVYLVISIDLWTRMPWGWEVLARQVFGGVIPVFTFFAERRITRDVNDSLDS